MTGIYYSHHFPLRIKSLFQLFYYDIVGILRRYSVKLVNFNNLLNTLYSELYDILLIKNGNTILHDKILIVHRL